MELGLNYFTSFVNPQLSSGLGPFVVVLLSLTSLSTLSGPQACFSPGYT